MKKFLLIAAAVFLFSGVTSASASDWNTDLQNAVRTGDFQEINIIAANNPAAQGQIAMYLLSQTQANMQSHPGTAVKLFNAAAPFAGQIGVNDGAKAGRVIYEMLALANNTSFQKANPALANDIFTSALAMSSEPNIVVANPLLHNAALAYTNEFLGNNPALADKKLNDEIDLALQVGTLPPIGAHNVINPSAE